MTKTPRPFRGAEWRRTHQATADSVLGVRVRRVTSRGTRFYNQDDWTARSFMASMCEWAKLNPGADPTYHDVFGWVKKANLPQAPNPSITIAQTPDDLPQRLAMALVGGIYHEAWHTEMSRRTPITMDEVWPQILEAWQQAPQDPATGHRPWGKLTRFLLSWDNIIDDVRIERRGCEKYPGAQVKMEALQDLILTQEGQGRETQGHRTIPKNSMSVVVGAFRDLGLGYQTPLQDVALASYQTADPKAWALVTDPKGPVAPLLARAIDLPAAPNLEGMWLAMEMVTTLLTWMPPAPPPPPPSSGGQGGEDEDHDEGPPSDGGDEEEGPPSEGPPPRAPRVFKRGDRATLKTGPNKGREVEVTLAGLPHPDTGIQDLEFALVEPD